MKFIHIGILTPLLEHSIDGFKSFPGFEETKWVIREVDFPKEAVLTGKGSRMRTAIANLGGVVYELIQPLDPTSYHSDELRKKGECLHHTAFMCLENQKEVVDAQLNRGGKSCGKRYLEIRIPFMWNQLTGNRFGNSSTTFLEVWNESCCNYW